MALTASTVLLATFAVLDSLAAPLSADTDTSSVFTTTVSSEVSSTWTTDTVTSSALTVGPAAVVSTSTSAVSGSVVTSGSQDSTSASSTEPSSASSTLATTSSGSTSTTTVVSTIYQAPPTVTITAPPQTVTDTITIIPPPTPAPTVEQTAWSAPAQMTDLSAFNIQNFAYGHQNMRIIVPAPLPDNSTAGSNISSEAMSDAQLAIASAASAGIIPPPPSPTPANSNSNSSADSSAAFLQLFYPANSVNPAQSPQGGADFYATPLDLSRARNVSLEYSVFFPADFDFVEAGKLPGIYGGHDGCSGGDDALECWSTRLMWRAKGLGELYLYAPKDKQTPALCATPPQSVCDAAYGLSIGRGAFAFAPGNWTHVRQTVTLNTPGMQDGGFALDVDGVRVIERGDVYYRGAPVQEGDGGDGDGEEESAVPGVPLVPVPAPAPVSAPANGIDPASTAVPAPATTMSVASSSSAGPTDEEGYPTRVQDDDGGFIKAPFHIKVDSVLGDMNIDANASGSVARRDGSFTPAFAPSAEYSPFAPTVPAPVLQNDTSGTGMATGNFTPAFAPPDYAPPAGQFAGPDVKFADPSGLPSSSSDSGDASTTTTVCETTTLPATQTVTETVYPTRTQTAYVMALETDGPFSAASADASADPDSDGVAATPVGFTGLFFSTFFGGHEAKYATPRDQFTWFKDFAMTINA
ncbi:hypothetical protein OH77DRAFT_1496264 [Trametes cingulata]|nr:hypothetical protein OH77DRAFT_1496264 [Trametes cingulata]